MSYELDQTLSSVIQSLANFFGTTTEIVMENAPAWLAKYGWYITIKNLPFSIFAGGAVFVVIAFFLGLLVFDADFSCKTYKKFAIILGVVIILIGILIPIILCIISPEIVGLEALIAK